VSGAAARRAAYSFCTRNVAPATCVPCAISHSRIGVVIEYGMLPTITTRPTPCPAQMSAERDVEDVSAHDRDARKLSEVLGQQVGEALVELDRYDMARPLREDAGQRAGARADFDHDVVRRHAGRLDDAGRDVGPREEILPPLLARLDPPRQKAVLHVRHVGERNPVFRPSQAQKAAWRSAW
jgi:hypothetical protein